MEDREDDDLAIRARQYLVDLGILVDSGERRRAPNGEMQIVWGLSERASIIEHYRQLGMTWEEAAEKAKQQD
jgi:hypothetical protein